MMVFTLFLGKTIQAQQVPKPIYTPTPYTKNTWKHPNYNKPKFILGLDSRFSVVEKNSTHFFGVRTGVELKGRIRFGVGLYYTNKPIQARGQYYIAYPNEIFNSSIRFYYAAIFAEYVPLHKKHFEIAIPHYLGFGWANERFYSTIGHKLMGKQRDAVTLLEVSVLVTYRACRWFGVGLGFGYRGVLNKNELLKASYNGPITLLRFKIYLIEIYRMMDTQIRQDKGLPAKLY